MNRNSIPVVEAIVEKWTPIAQAASETAPSQPVPVIVGEAQDLAHFAQVHWEPVTGRIPRPGMKAALISGLIETTTIEEILDLAAALSRTHATFRAVNQEELSAPVERGEFLLSELKQSLEFIFDDGVNDKQDAELSRLSESHSDTSSHDKLALSLEGFAYYANDHKEQLAQLPDFETSMIDEALEVAHRLRSQSWLKLSNEARSQQKEALIFRNRFVTLLEERVAKMRRAARFVFRHRPDISREFGSSHDRRRRARQRAAQRGVDPNATATTQEVSS
jgi:hypothetical protein